MIKSILFCYCNYFFNSHNFSFRKSSIWKKTFAELFFFFLDFRALLCVVNSVLVYLGLGYKYDDNKRCDFLKSFFAAHHDFWQRQSWDVILIFWNEMGKKKFFRINTHVQFCPLFWIQLCHFCKEPADFGPNHLLFWWQISVKT